MFRTFIIASLFTASAFAETAGTHNCQITVDGVSANFEGPLQGEVPMYVVRGSTFTTLTWSNLRASRIEIGVRDSSLDLIGRGQFDLTSATLNNDFSMQMNGQFERGMPNSIQLSCTKKR